MSKHLSFFRQNKPRYKVAYVYTPVIENIPAEWPSDYTAEFDSPILPKSFIAATKAIPYISSAEVFYSDSTLEGRLAQYKPDIVFNTAETLFGFDVRRTDLAEYLETIDPTDFTMPGREAATAQLLEKMGLKFTGTGSTSLDYLLDKASLTDILKSRGISAPQSWVVSKMDQVDGLEKEFANFYPLFIKPDHGGSSQGIEDNNKIENIAELRERLPKLIEKYGEIVIQQYVGNREVTVGIIGNNVLPIAEVMVDGGYEKRSLKWGKEDSIENGFMNTRYNTFTKVQQEQIRDYALRVKDALGIRDFCRMDIRINETSHGNLNMYAVDVNGLPGLQPIHSRIVLEYYEQRYTVIERHFVELDYSFRRAHYHELHRGQKPFVEADEKLLYQFKWSKYFVPKIALDFVVSNFIHKPLYNRMIRDILEAGMIRNNIPLE